MLIAGGIGITPFISMTRYVVEAGLKPPTSLIYSNRDQQSRLSRGTREGLGAKDNDCLGLVLTMTDDPRCGKARPAR